MKIDMLSKMIPFFDFNVVEKIAVDAVKHNFVAMKVNHLSGAVHFGNMVCDFILPSLGLSISSLRTLFVVSCLLAIRIKCVACFAFFMIFHYLPSHICRPKRLVLLIFCLFVEHTVNTECLFFIDFIMNYKYVHHCMIGLHGNDGVSSYCLFT